MRAFFAFLFVFALGCADEPSRGTINGTPAASVTVPAPAPFDPVKATAKGKEFVTGLYGTKNPNGPICLPEKVSGDYTQCSFTYNEIDGTLKAGTILCSNKGCFEGQAPVAVPAEDRPVTIVNNTTGSSGGMDNSEWLLWYLMFSNGGTSYHYNSWHANTPYYGRSAYYTTSYVPTAQSRSYYTTTYSAPVKAAATTKYSSKTTPTVTTSSSGYSKSTSTATSTSTSTKSTPAATTTSSSSKSSGWGTSSRSSGYKSSGSSSSSRSSSSRSGRR